MAKRAENRLFNVAVVGLSGTEKEKGVTGIGKSCLCNRFMQPQADDYHTDHISVLSQSDFGGCVVNNDHFLYWGEVSKTSDEGLDFSFRVVEQTEFIDDSSFQPFKSGKTEPYYKRCAATKLQSAEKLMYICKNQLGLEHDFDRKLLPDGKLLVDGFLCLFDVSMVPQRSVENLVEYTGYVLNSLLKTKKPTVLVLTKFDEVNDIIFREAEKLLNRKEYRGNIPVIETSAHRNVNVELAFITLGHLIEKTKNRPKIVQYLEASRSQLEVCEVAKEAYVNLVRSQVTDYKALWIPTHRKLQHNENYVHFVELCGTEQARKLFQRHVQHLKDEFTKRKQDVYLGHLKYVLKEILPDLVTIADRSWPSLLRWMERQDFMDKFFVIIPDGLPWKLSDYIEMADTRIPFDLLDGPDAELVFRDHVNALRAENRRNELLRQFKQLLEDNHNVSPGKSLGEVAIFFLGRECFSGLSEEDKTLIYEQHQRELRERAKVDFLELLLENAEWFSKFERRQVTPDHLREINDKLQIQTRYRALCRLEEERKVILLNHLGFTQSPSKDRCHFKANCMDCVIERLLSTKVHRPQSWNRNSQFLLDAENNRLNLVLLGAEELANQLAKEIRLQCIDDEYTLGEELYSLDYRLIDGDVSLPHNSFKTADFLPQGCFCVFNSMATLEYLQRSLEKTVLSDLQRDSRRPFQGLPIVIVLAHNPGVSEKGLLSLRVEGQQLADRLQCPFIDIPSSLMVDSSKRFHQDQIGLAMHSLVKCIKHRSSFVNPWQIAESIEPDIRILMCLMCGDAFNLDLPLSPLLNHQCCYVTSDKVPTVTLETFLDESKRKVEVTVTSYHSATLVRDDLYHGFLLVFSAKRKASLENLRSFAGTIPPVPTKLLAVTESGGANAFFSSEHTQSLMTEGNALADELAASFSTTCANFQLQTASYTPFFKECWEKKMETESAFRFSGEESSEALESSGEQQKLVGLSMMAIRPPAALPKVPVPRMQTFLGGKSSTSNSQSTEDSDPIYDRPHLHRCHSDSDAERGSSASPPPPQVTDSSPYAYASVSEEVYSEITAPDTAPLIKPSQLKAKRNMYAERYRKSFPSASSSFASSSYREDSTDTDSSIRSPNTYHRTPLDATTPHYQFRKSNSMRLALQEKGVYDESVNPWVPARGLDFCRGPDPHAQQGASTKPLVRQLDLNRYKEVRQVLNRNINQSGSQPSYSMVKAPLATPEHIEFADYAQVKDAIPRMCKEDEEPENDYAQVADALPAGKLARIRSRKKQDCAGGDIGSDSDSEFSSLERHKQKEDIYSRVNRRPTPHKKKHKPRHSEGPLPPPLPPYTDERQMLLQADHLEKLRNNSPSEGSEGTGDEQQSSRKLKKKRSFRSKKKKPLENSDTSIIISPPWSDSDLTNFPLGKASMDDGAEGLDDSIGSREYGSPRYGEDGEDMTDGWRRKLKIRLDPEKQRQKKEEKKAREDGKKKQKEEERRQKEQKKIQQKLKKKIPGGMSSQTSVSGTLDEMAQSDDNLIPFFLQKCIGFIEEEGLTAEGLYRVPGNKAHVDLLLERFRDDPFIDIRSLDIQVNAVATALKQFFQEIHEPVIPSNLYEQLIAAADMIKKDSKVQVDEGTRLSTLRELLNKLPESNFAVLRYLISHLCRVTQHYHENSMDSQNLAICWWPTLFRPDITDFNAIAAVSRFLSDIVQILIDQYTFFFPSIENEV